MKNDPSPKNAHAFFDQPRGLDALRSQARKGRVIECAFFFQLLNCFLGIAFVFHLV